MRAEQEAGGGEEEESRSNMDTSLLRQQYRCTRDRQKRHTQVLLFGTGERKLFVYLLSLASRSKSSSDKNELICLGEKKFVNES